VMGSLVRLQAIVADLLEPGISGVQRRARHMPRATSGETGQSFTVDLPVYSTVKHPNHSSPPSPSPLTSWAVPRGPWSGNLIIA
jgi:hypothetical protein